MQTELGVVTHNYWYDDGSYFRQLLGGGPVEVWSALFGWAPSLNVSRKAG
jgi:hypothetical protein